MTTSSSTVSSKRDVSHRRRLLALLPRAVGTALALGLVAAFSGCETTGVAKSPVDNPRAEITLREGDVIKVSFPAAPNLDTAPQPIRRDGKITLPLVGEVSAVGVTPTELQSTLITLFSKQLVSKEVVVTVVSSTFSVFVDGTVVHPGKIVADHPITVLEAIMESGGFDYNKADTKRVLVIRHKSGSSGYDYFTLDLKRVLDGTQSDLFYLAPGDMVHVPEKFSWF